VARVNIVKRIKSDGRWIMRSVPRKPSGEWDWQALPEGRYYVEWYEEGTRREPAGSTVAQALEVQRRKKHQIDGLQLGLVPAPRPAPAPTPIDSSRSLRALIDRYLDQVETLKKPNTFRKYEAVLNRFAGHFGERTFEGITIDELNDFVVHLKKSGMEANTVLHNMIIIAQFFKRSGRGGITRQLHLPERTTSLPVAYTEEELARFFVACDDFHRALYSTFRMTGFREQEVVYLFWSDINLDLRTIRVNSKREIGFTPKRCEEREVPITAQLADILARHSKRPNSRLRAEILTLNSKLLQVCLRCVSRREDGANPPSIDIVPRDGKTVATMAIPHDFKFRAAMAGEHEHVSCCQTTNGLSILNGYKAATGYFATVDALVVTCCA
jgi:integrase/recombinase XerD